MRDSCARVEGGTAFFVSQTVLFTCAHCVAKLTIGKLTQVLYKKVRYTGTVVFKSPERIKNRPPWPWPDVAIIEISDAVGLPLKLDRRTPTKRHNLNIFGFAERSNAGGEERQAHFGGKEYPNTEDD